MLSPNRVARAELQALGWEMRPLARGARSVGPQTPDVGRGGTGWDGARQQVSALPLGTPRSQAAVTSLTHLHRRSRCSDVTLLHSSPVKEMNDHRRSGMGTQERAMGTLPL